MIDEGVRSIAELLNDVGPHRGEHLFSLVSDHAGSTWPVIVNQIIQLYEAEEKRLGRTPSTTLTGWIMRTGRA